MVLSLQTSLAAALSADQSRCQKALTTAGEKFEKRTAAALAACQNRLSAGRLPAATDCRADARTAAKLVHSRAQLERKVERSCSDAVVASLILGDDCARVSTVGALTACIEATHA